MRTLIFENYKFRASQIGHIMTNLESITSKQLEELETLQTRKQNAEKGTEKPLTANMEEKLKELISKRDAPDELPSGAISYLEEVFRDVFWGRKRSLQNKFLEKGNLCEQDALDLLSEYDNDFYHKNDEYLENDYVCGTPDNRQGIIRDTKANYDLESFDKSELTKLYEWQIKTYDWLDGKKEGELCYCLVNNPLHHLETERKSLWYKMGMPDEESEEWKEALKQLERNMIFDPIKFKEQYPHYTFENTESDLYIPPQFRVKKFRVTLEESDIKNIISRVKLARAYLIHKEIEVKNKIQEYAKNIENQII